MSSSSLAGSSDWTSRLLRRSMKGLRIMWRRRSCCWFSFVLDWVCDSMSFENHSLNSSWESNKVGMMKCNNAHSSKGQNQVDGGLVPCMVFWIGVPVSKRRFRQCKPSKIFHRELEELLIACASSRIMYCHLIFWKYFSS